jgi:L,D-transpeptidase catalytic domain
VSSHRRVSAQRSAKPRRWRGLAGRLGWRTYAVSSLAAITVTALFQADASPAPRTGEPGARSPGFHAIAAAAGGFVGLQHVKTVHIGTDGDACADNGYARLAIVSISEQQAWMCEKHRQVYSTAVTTGAVLRGSLTPTGSWVVQNRERDRYLVGPGYRDYVHYWVPFNGDFGFHDATWQQMSFGSPDYTTKGSHGCVHLPMPAMRWLYGWAQVGHTVVTVQA